MPRSTSSRRPSVAIIEAVALVGDGDAILWAGPGHQDYRDIRGVRTPYSARELARRALRDAGWPVPEPHWPVPLPRLRPVRYAAGDRVDSRHPSPSAPPRRVMSRVSVPPDVASGSQASTTRSISSDDAEERQTPLVEGVDGLLVRRVEHSRIGAAGAPRPSWRAHRGERVLVERLERPRRGGGPVERLPDAATRCGQSRPSEIGSRMSGGEAWAMVDPSTNSTIECTIDCGCTTTSMWWYVTSKSRCASITSRPLFTRVAEFVVTTRPMSHVGVGECLGGRHLRERRARCDRGKDRRMPSARVGAPRRGRPTRSACAIAECSESTGTIWPGAASARDEIAADDERLLVRKRERAPHLERGEGRARAPPSR